MARRRSNTLRCPEGRGLYTDVTLEKLEQRVPKVQRRGNPLPISQAKGQREKTGFPPGDVCARGRTVYFA